MFKFIRIGAAILAVLVLPALLFLALLQLKVLAIVAVAGITARLCFRNTQIGWYSEFMLHSAARTIESFVLGTGNFA